LGSRCLWVSFFAMPLVSDLLGTWTVSAISAWTVESPCEGMDLWPCCLWHWHGQALIRRKLVVFEQSGKPILSEYLGSGVRSDTWVGSQMLFPHIITETSFANRRVEATIMNISKDDGAVHLEQTDGFARCLFMELAGCGNNKLTVTYSFRSQDKNGWKTHYPLPCAVHRERKPAHNCSHGMLPESFDKLDVVISYSMERSNLRTGCAHNETHSNHAQNAQMQSQSEWWQRDWLPLLLAAAGPVVLATLCMCAVVVVRRSRKQKQSSPAGSSFDLDDGEFSTSEFESQDLAKVIGLGSQEHWLIKPSAVTLDEQSSSIAQPKQRGFLHGVTEVWVKSATQDCSVDDLLVELRILRRARHSNIVAFYGATWQGNDSILLVLEWMPGSDFEEYVKQRRNNGNFSDQLRLLTSKDAGCQIDEQRLLVDVSRGMQYLHSQRPKIVHRGLQPSVVLIDERRTPCVAKLSNFSKALILPQLNSTDESLMPCEEAGQLKADIFDFGLIALFAMTSEVPDPSLLDEHLQKARQLAEGELGSLASVLHLAESCLSDACTSFTEVFYSLSQTSS